ncbi:MAG: hypothetical protein GX875_04745, partial [Propionibacterium sp.]|nr:hypothetical protein [Propionibacterium sp.]
MFRLPTDQASVPFTLAGLLDWASLVPSLAPGALPPGTTRGPAPRAPGVEDTFIEFPYRLLISPVGEIGWVHPIEPITRDGRTELWHTKAVSTHTEPANPNPGPVPIRALYVRPGTDLKNSFPWSMTSEELRDLVTLTSDFSNKPRPPGNEIAVPMRWRVKVDQLKKAGKLDIPPPATLEGRQVVLTSLGASMDLRGSFAFPRDDQDPGELKEVGITVPNLLRYVHVAGLGRDQHVEVVKRGFVDTGHRAVLFRVTHREYEPEVLGKRVGLDGPYGVFGTIGYLRQYEQIIITQPTLHYEAFRGGYPHDGREMPLRSIEFTTLVSPELAASNSKNAFWLRDEQGDVAFDFVATDWRGRRISSSRPLMFIPYEAVGNVDKVEEEFNKGPARRRTAPLYGQTFALADPSQTNPDSTSGPVESLTLSVSRRKPGGRLPDDYLPSWVIHLALAQITLEPLQRLTGSGEVHRVELAAKYLDHGLDPAGNPTGAFVRLKDGAAKVEMGARDGGGLSAPAMALDTISAHAGLTSSKLAAGLTSKDLSDLFGDMKLFGTVPLTKLLGQIPSATAELFAKAGRSDEELDALANDPSERLEIPILRCRVLRDSNHRPIATITRFLWKPVLATSAINLKPAFDLGNATFLLDVLSTTPLD